MAVTKKTNVIIPEIMGPAIGAKLDKALAMMPYAAVDNALEGKEGDEVTIPVWDYAGDAVEVAEGEEVPTSDLACNVRKYKVRKAMKAFPITDEATDSAFSNPGEEAERQNLMSIKGKVEQDLIDACYGGNVLTVEHNGALDYTAIVRAVAAFNYESNPDKVLFINPAQEESLLLNPYFQDKSKFGEAVGIDGVIGKIAGCWIKKSKRIEYVEPTSQHGGYWKNVIVLVQNEKLDDEDPTAALTIFSKKGITLETQRDALNQTQAIVGSKHYIATLTNSRKVIISKNIVAPALPYTLTYDGNGGTGTVEAQTAPGGTSVTLRANAYEKEGLTYMKWNTKADGTGTDYEPGDSFVLTEDTTLYAVWGYEISYNANGGSGTKAADVVKDGDTFEIPANPYTYINYRFTGWNTADDGTGTAYAAGAEMTPQAAVTLYAQWVDVLADYPLLSSDFAGKQYPNNVTHGLELNSSTDDISGVVYKMHIAFGYDGTGTVSDVPVGCSNSDLAVSWLSNTDNNNPVAVAYRALENPPTSTADLTRWISGLDIKTVNAPMRWGTSSGGDLAVYTPSLDLLLVDPRDLFGAIKLRPIYLSGEYTKGFTSKSALVTYQNKITFNPNSGSGTMDVQWLETGVAGTIATNTFTRDGYTFSGWNTAADGSGTSYADGGSITLNANVTLYAQWAAETPSADPFAGKSFTLEDDGTYVSAVFDNQGQYQMQVSEDGTTWMAVMAATAYTVVNNTVEIDVGGPEPVTASLDGNGNLTFDAGGTPVTMSADATPKSILPYTEPDESEGE